MKCPARSSIVTRTAIRLNDDAADEAAQGDPGGGEEKCGLLSAKGGLMMGTKKVGAFSSPRKKAILIITRKIQNASKIFKIRKNIFFAESLLDNVAFFIYYLDKTQS